jgi:integrase
MSAAGNQQGKRSTAPTLAEVLAVYPTKKRLRESTITNYRQVVRRYLSEWKDLPVTDITKEMVFQRHRELGDEVSGNYANLIMQVLRALLYFAMEHYETPDGQPIIAVNPVSKLSKNQMWYRKRRRQGVIPDHKLGDWYRAVMACASTNVRDYLLLLVMTGLRRNEAATLRWADVDFEARTMSIREEIAKNHREHKLPLSSFLFTLLSRRRTEITDSEYVFPGRYGGHMVSYIRQINSKVALQSGCEFCLHDLR